MGYSQHSGVVIVCDGSEEADQRIARVLWNDPGTGVMRHARSEEHTSELQSLMRISYAVFCLKKKTHTSWNTTAQKAIDCATWNTHIQPCEKSPTHDKNTINILIH